MAETLTQSEQGGGEWLPIETAPKDGMRLLLWDTFCVFEGFWNGQWCNTSLSGRPHTTHWMPLPTPPVKQ